MSAARELGFYWWRVVAPNKERGLELGAEWTIVQVATTTWDTIDTRGTRKIVTGVAALFPGSLDEVSLDEMDSSGEWGPRIEPPAETPR